MALGRSSEQDDTAPIVVREGVTADEYLAMPPSQQHNLIDGVLYESGEPGVRHDEVLAAIVSALASYVLEAGGKAFMTPMQCRLGTSTVLQPDLGYVVPGHEGMVREQVFGAPDLVVEVASKGTRRFDNELKLAAYARNGVREAWLVDPDNETVIVYCGNGTQWLDRQLVNFGADIPSEVVSVDQAGLLALRR